MIHRLTPQDLPAFRAMQMLFSEVFGMPEHYAAAPPSDAYVRDLLSDPTFIALTATDGDRTVGALAAYVLRKFEQERSEVYIYDLAVATDHRRRGIATALIERVQEIAAEAGAWVVFVQADHGDTAPITLYSRLGTREDVLHFDLPVRKPKG